jgi:hypothetical protein
MNHPNLLSVMTCKQLALSLPAEIDLARRSGATSTAQVLMSDLRWAIKEIVGSGNVHEMSDFWFDLERRCIEHGVELK